MINLVDQVISKNQNEMMHIASTEYSINHTTIPNIIPNTSPYNNNIVNNQYLSKLNGKLSYNIHHTFILLLSY
jgi:nucleoid-associated protein YejK